MIVAAADRIVIGGMCRLLPDDREVAWAEKHLHVDPDIAWILGNYVEADNANDNGHIFPLEDLKAAIPTLINKPLNVLHQGRYVVGSFVGAELTTLTEHAAEGETQRPILEALAVFWRGVFNEEYELVKRAHSEGAAFYSMECIPEEIGCVAEGCEMVAKYMGRDHDTYCEHMRGQGVKRLLKPHFSAGALIIPPVKPGWRHADISSLARKEDRQLLESVYAQVEEEAPHLDAATWEHMMIELVELAKEFSPKRREDLAKQKKAMPHGGFPIENAAQLKDAIQAFGRAKDKPAAKAHIIRRAKALGLEKLIPDEWK